MYNNIFGVKFIKGMKACGLPQKKDKIKMLLMTKISFGIFIESAPSVYCSSSSSFYISRSRWMGDLGFEGQRVTTLNLQFVP